ncbi:MAG TPA: glucoamylase family protein, partial [Kiritimatiellia bacterium]
LQLYFWQYPHAWIDFRYRNDGLGRNHHEIALDSILHQRQRAIDLHNADPVKYDMIGTNCWGWTAAGCSDGYRQAAPWPLPFLGDTNVEHASDSGSIMPIGLPGCMVFAGTETMACMKHVFEKYYIDGWNPGAGERPVWNDTYGFLNTLNKSQPWNTNVTNHFHPINAGIDYGPNVLLLENYKLGSTWRWFMQNTNISAGMTTLGFGATQHTYVARFAGGTNDFGCAFGSWNNDATTVSVSFVNATLTNAYVSGTVVRIVADNSDEGAWIDLCNRDARAKALVSFWVRGHTGAEAIDVGLKDTFGLERKVQLAEFSGGAVATNWTQVRIPIERFCLTGDVTNDVWPGSLALLSFAFTSAGGGLDIDHVAFTRDDLAPVQPTNAFGVAGAGSHIRVHWNPAGAERDIVGYHVWRRTDSTSGFVRVTSQLVPAYRGMYEDSNLLVRAGQEIRYAIQAFDNSEPANSSSFSLEKIARGGQLDVDWQNAANPNVLGGTIDGSWGGAAPAFAFVFTNGPDGTPEWVRRSTVTATNSGHFIDANGSDVRNYWALHFWIRGEAGGEQVFAGLKDTNSVEQKFDIANALASGIVETNWQEVILPFGDFSSVDLSAIARITFTHGTTGTVYIADLGLLQGQHTTLLDRTYTEAEDYTRQDGSGGADYKPAASGGEVLGNSWGADSNDYADFEFQSTRVLTAPTLYARYACNVGNGRALEVRLNGIVVGTIACTNTAGWGELAGHFSLATLVLPSLTVGVHTLTFRATNA